MLLVFYGNKDLDFHKLCQVYLQSNTLSGGENYTQEQPVNALALAEEDFIAYIRREFFRVKGSFYAVWEESGNYLSAVRLEPFRDGLLLTSLETHPQYRKMGYGEKLIRAVADYAGKNLYAHVYRKNKASMALHRKCGFQTVHDFAKLIDGTVSSAAYTLCLPYVKNA